MLIIEIALGIVLGVILLVALPYLVVGGLIVVAVAVALGVAVLTAVYAPVAFYILLAGAATFGIWTVWSQAVDREKARIERNDPPAPSMRPNRSDYFAMALVSAVLLLITWGEPRVGLLLIAAGFLLSATGVGLWLSERKAVRLAAQKRARKSGRQPVGPRGSPIATYCYDQAAYDQLRIHTRGPAEAWPLRQVITGLQTGADQAGLFAAEALGIPTGGYCTRDARTEAGSAMDLAKRFKLECFPTDDYSVRTLLNVRQADGTVIFAAFGRRARR